MNKYNVIFKYVDLGSKGHKYIKANSKKEAMQKFNKLYRDYNVEVKDVKLMEENK